MSPPVRENINAVLELRRAVCLTQNGRDRVEILGPLSAPLKETFDIVVRNKRVTARDVADHFHVAINTASNRLASLAELGLIVRTGKRTVIGGGEENLFESLI
jgi:predicted transcriptional regulator